MDGKQVIEHALKFEIQNPPLSLGPKTIFLGHHSKPSQNVLSSVNLLLYPHISIESEKKGSFVEKTKQKEQRRSEK